MDTGKLSSQVETNKGIIQRYFEAYNTKNEAIFDEIISPEYIDHGQSAYMGSLGLGVEGAKNDLKYSLDRLDELNYVVEELIASQNYPDLVGAYWKGTLALKATLAHTEQSRKITYRGISIYRIQNGKMIETWQVVDGWPSNL
ncbi:MAG TPA: ester cyclase [Nitrososphaeraceae archaeon]